MTYKEALAILRTHKTYVGEMDADKLIEALDIAEATIEKQIPKKPTIVHFWSRDEMNCPNCDSYLISKDTTGITIGNKVNFCDECGQAIDWSEEK